MVRLSSQRLKLEDCWSRFLLASHPFVMLKTEGVYDISDIVT